jgi:4-hydroxy-4-methyl-2-oxoglutarate aldolase
VPAVDGLAAALLELGAATLGESGARPMLPRITAVWRGAQVAGPACPVRCAPGDNLAVHVAVARAAPGSVLVVDVGGVPGRGYWGEVLTTGAQARGIAGLVIDGGVRDTQRLEAMRFPVFSSLVALPGATKRQQGSVGRSARVGGVTVSLGDWVVADGDGVVVIAAGGVPAVLDAGRDRASKEDKYFAALREGATTVELLGLDTGPVDVAPDLGS